METIKAVITNKYGITLSQVQTLFELDYIIQYKQSDEDIYQTSEHIKDLKIALFMFDQKLVELEGH